MSGVDGRPGLCPAALVCVTVMSNTPAILEMLPAPALQELFKVTCAVAWFGHPTL